MTNQQTAATSRAEESPDPLVYAARIRQMLTETVDHVRKDTDRVDDPRARALFETTAEVLLGLRRAYEHFEGGSEKAWK